MSGSTFSGHHPDHPPPIRPPPTPTDHPPTTPPPRPASSESARQRILAGQLTLHEYRKLQQTPSPPAQRGGKTLKRKVAVVGLSSQVAKKDLPQPHPSSRSAAKPAPLQIKVLQENTESRPVNTGEAEAFYRSYLDSQSDNRSKPSAQRPSLDFPAQQVSEDSELSVSNFPRPPSLVNPSAPTRSFGPPRQKPFLTSPRLATSPFTPATPTVIHHRGASFDILNPHQSLDISQLQLPEHHKSRPSSGDPCYSSSSDSGVGRMTTPPDASGIAGSLNRQNLPQRALFQDLPTAHSSITARSGSGQNSPGLPPAQPLSPVLTDLPLPPVPVAVRTVQGPYEPSLASTASDMTITIPPPKISAEKISPALSWKEKLGNVFSRRSARESQLLPTIEEKRTSEVIRSMPKQPRPSTYLPPLKGSGPTSQSAPYLGTTDYQAEIDRVSKSAAHISRHYYDDSSIYHDGGLGGAPSGSLATSSSYGAGSVPYGLTASRSDLDYAAEVDAHRFGFGITRPQNAEEGLVEIHDELREKHETMLQERHGNSTVGSIVKKYGDNVNASTDFEDISLDNHGEEENKDFEEGSTRHPMSRLSNLELGKPVINRNSDNIDAEKGQPSPTRKYNHRWAPTPPTEPPNSPLPPGPPTDAARTCLKHRNLSTVSHGLNRDDSYGDSHNLLNVSFYRDIEGGEMVRESSDPLASTSAKASSGVLGNPSENDITRPGYLRSASAAGQNGGLRIPSVDRVRSHHPSSGSNVSSRPSSDKNSEILQEEVFRELRRLSGLSNLSGSVFVVRDATVDFAQFGQDGYSDVGSNAEDLGPGSSQSSSSRSNGAMSRELSLLSGGSPTAESYQEQICQDPKVWMGSSRRNVNAKGSFGSSFQGPRPSADSENRPAGMYEDDGDWETVAESGAFSRYGPSRVGQSGGMVRGLTGSSIADCSSHGSLDADYLRNYPFGQNEPVVQHPADQRFDHTYRLGQSLPGNHPVLLPTYNFSGGVNFPNRNALTPPIPSASYVNNYQHPEPLSPDHRHPFQSSPPVMISPKYGSRAYKGLYQTNGESQNLGDSSESSNVIYDSQIIAYANILPSNNNLKNLPSSSQSDNSIGGVGMDGSYATDAWAQSYGEPGPTIVSQNPPNLPILNGSFSKVTTLGPRVNVTGSPNGTGMHEVGSSLVGSSSPAQQWSSSPYDEQTPKASRLNSHSQPKSPLAQGYTTEALEDLQPEYTRPVQGYFNAQIRHNEQQRRALGLAEAGFHPAMPHQPPRVAYANGRFGRMSGVEAWTRPISYNRTPELPPLWTEKERRIVLEGRRARARYPEKVRARRSSLLGKSALKYRHTVSLSILCVCTAFPVIGWIGLMLFGYGYMDGIVAHYTDGEILKLDDRHKRIAIRIVWLIIFLIVVALIASCIVISLRYH